LPLLDIKRNKYTILKPNTSLGSKISWARIIGSKLNPYGSKCAEAKNIKLLFFSVLADVSCKENFISCSCYFIVDCRLCERRGNLNVVGKSRTVHSNAGCGRTDGDSISVDLVGNIKCESKL
jgi:hypothetical protein